MAGVYRRLPAVLLLAFVVGQAAPTASAGGHPRPPQDVPAVAQYVETFPDAAGPTTHGTKQRAVPGAVAVAIRKKGGSDASKLIRVLQSPTYGGPEPAPQPRADGGPARPGSQLTAMHSLTRHGGPVASVVTTAPGGTAKFWLLLLASTFLPIAIRVASARNRLAGD